MKRKINLKNVKGSYDYLPREQIIRNFIIDTLKGVFESYGYKPLETPILCYYDLLAGKYDESNDLLNEIYKLSDQGNRELGLRYDLTVPFAKCIAMEKDLRLPFKRYEIGKVFRDGPIKTGRDREFMQCDVDVVGLDGQLIEAELISLWLEGYSRLGIDVLIKYNSRNLMRGLIQNVGIDDDDEITKVVTIIDKIDKLSKEDFLLELSKLGLNVDNSNKLLEYFNMNLDELNEKFNISENELILKGLNELLNLRNLLDGLNISDKVTFTPSLARGQDYYTGNVFEVFDKSGTVTSSIGGGGRYDNMITDFIGDENLYPAVGISFGLSSIYEILKKNANYQNKSLVDLYIIPMGTEVRSLALANKIRSYGLNVDIEMKSKKIKKALDFANKENIPFVIVLGENEINDNEITIKKMNTGEEFKTKLNDYQKIVDIIKNNKNESI